MPIPPPLPPRANTPPKKKRWRLPLLILGVIVGGVLLLVLLGFLYIWLAKDMPVTEDDKQVLVTATWVTDWDDELVVDPAKESFKKVRNVDGSYDLRYEYEGGSLYILCDVTADKTTSDAKASYFGITVGQAIGNQLEGLEMRERPDLLRWGDQSECALILNDSGAPSGNYFACRKGTRTFSLVLVGVFFEEQEVFREFLLPILRRLKDYQP